MSSRFTSRGRARVDTAIADHRRRHVGRDAVQAAFRAWAAASVLGELLAFGAYFRRRSTARNAQRSQLAPRLNTRRAVER